MIQSVAASKAAKLIAACVCPIAGTGALTMAVPQVRQAVHKATEPRAYAKPKTRVRAAPNALASAGDPCLDNMPLALSDPKAMAIGPQTPLQVASNNPGPGSFLPPYTPGGNPPVIGPGGGGGPGGTDPTDPVPGVPEASTWVQLILGFGLVGGAVRASHNGRGSSEGKPAGSTDGTGVDLTTTA